MVMFKLYGLLEFLANSRIGVQKYIFTTRNLISFVPEMHLLQHPSPPLRSWVLGDHGERASVSHKLDLTGRNGRLKVSVQFGVLRFLQVIVKVADFIGERNTELDKCSGGDGRLLHGFHCFVWK